MRILVCIIIYNRLDNLKEWVRCWHMCQKYGAEFVVIHNIDTPEDSSPYKELCIDNKISYYARENIGMDIGAFQDVCYNRIESFPEWDYLLWITDDVIPMSKDFVSPYISSIHSPNVGVSCLEISNEVKQHIRTTGFLISKKLAQKLIFPSDPIKTKSECFQFEHRSNSAFYEQIKNMKKDIIQVHRRVEKSYLWDTHNRARFNRWEEHYKEFPK